MSSSFFVARLVSRLLAGATDIRPREGRAVLASGLLFFLVLAALMILRPLREAMGVEEGIEQLRVLFLYTTVGTLLLVPAFGYLVSRLRRRVFLAVSFRVCAVILVGFYVTLALLPEDGRSVCRSVYYVYHSVFNLFLVSLFWAFMADLFNVTESKRLFPAVAIGGTLGAIAGSIAAGAIAASIAEGRWASWIRLEMLLLLAAGLLEAAVWTANLVARTRAARAAEPAEPRPIGGHPLAGITVLARSPYMRQIGLLILLGAVVSTFLYFTEVQIVAAATKSKEERAALFAIINAWTQVATLLAQALIAGRIMRYVGVAAALAVLPMYSAIGFVALAAAPTWTVYTIVTALHKAVQRGITRPARETLFTVLPREEKYKAKSFLDTSVSRAGDAGGSQIERLSAAWGLGIAGVALAVLPIALVWMTVSVRLGSAQSQLADRSSAGHR